MKHFVPGAYISNHWSTLDRDFDCGQYFGHPSFEKSAIWKDLTRN
jgi:hypothetical protein